MSTPKGLFVIGISGKKQHGKDAVCDILSTQLLNTKQIAFADPVYVELARACGTTVEFIKSNKAIFRKGLQWWGTDFRRTLKGENYWIEKWARNLIELAEPCCVISPDVRFENEAKVVKHVGGLLIRVNRTNFISSDQHPSEISLDSYTDFDLVIQNSGTLKDLEQTVTHELEVLCITHPTLKHWLKQPMAKSVSLFKEHQGQGKRLQH